MRRLAVIVEGTVQGVGFRPFIHAAATARGLSGWVRNAADALRLEVEGPDREIEGFLEALRSPPSAARVERIEARELPIQSRSGFQILESAHDARPRPTLPADQAVCAECAAEMDDPEARRYRYPFTNCSQCGPRYSIVEALPYDRPHTAMKGFALCDVCAARIREPTRPAVPRSAHRMPGCGPRLRLVSASGRGSGRRECGPRGGSAGLAARGGSSPEGARWLPASRRRHQRGWRRRASQAQAA